MARRPRLVRSAPAEGGFLEGVTVSPDGRWIASSDDQNRMHLYDAATNRLLRSYDAGPPPEGEQAFMLGAFSPDSTQLAVILEASRSTEPVRLLDPTTMQPTSELPLPRQPAGLGDRCRVQRRRSLPGRHRADASTGRYGGPSGQGYALVWDLRSPSTPPVRIPIGTGRPGGGPQPGRSDPLHERAVDGVRRRDRRADLAARARRVELRGVRHQPRGTLLALAELEGNGRAPGGCRGRRDGHQAAWAHEHDLRHPVLP